MPTKSGIFHETSTHWHWGSWEAHQPALQESSPGSLLGRETATQQQSESIPFMLPERYLGHSITENLVQLGLLFIWYKSAELC